MPHSEPHSHASTPSKSHRTRRSSHTHHSATPPPNSTTPLDGADDKTSIITQSSQYSQSPPEVQRLMTVAGERVRHAKCSPEFLQMVSTAEANKQVKIISGSEATTFFMKFLDEQGNHDASSFRRHRDAVTTRYEGREVVFALTAFDYGRKCVDYYMTWRGKARAQAADAGQIPDIDDEFRRVARRMDREFKKFRRASSVASSNGSHRSHKSHRARSQSPSSTQKTRPPEIPIPPQDVQPPPPVASDLPPIPEPPVSATCSVISLPYLNMVRGVPRGNRLPLTVANPDRLSMVSETGVSFESVAAADGTKEDTNGPTIAVIPPDTKTPIRDVFHPVPSGLTPIMKSSASIHSTESRSSNSSRSSQSSPGNDSSDHERKASSEGKYNFLIVLLADSLTKDGLSWHGLERNTSSRSQRTLPIKERVSPWAGPLARSHGSPLTRSKNVPSGNDSDSDGSFDEGGWKDSPVVPLKPMLEALGFVPSKAASVNSAYMADAVSAAYGPHGVNTPPVIPHMPFPTPAPSMKGSVMGSPAYMGNGMQLQYSAYSPALAANSRPLSAPTYLPAWINQHNNAGGGSPNGSRPPSRAPSALAYASPYMPPSY